MVITETEQQIVFSLTVALAQYKVSFSVDRIRTQDSPSSLQKFYIGVYDENSGEYRDSLVSMFCLGASATH